MRESRFEAESDLASDEDLGGWFLPLDAMVFCEGFEVFVDEGAVVAVLSGVWNLIRLVWALSSSLSFGLIAIRSCIYKTHMFVKDRKCANLANRSGGE